MSLKKRRHKATNWPRTYLIMCCCCSTELSTNSKAVSWGDRSIFFGGDVWRRGGCVGEDVCPAAVCWAKAASPWSSRRTSQWGRVPGLRDAEERHFHSLSKSKLVHPYQRHAWERGAARPHMQPRPWLWSALLRSGVSEPVVCSSGRACRRVQMSPYSRHRVWECLH